MKDTFEKIEGYLKMNYVDFIKNYEVMLCDFLLYYQTNHEKIEFPDGFSKVEQIYLAYLLEELNRMKDDHFAVGELGLKKAGGIEEIHELDDWMKENGRKIEMIQVFIFRRLALISPTASIKDLEKLLVEFKGVQLLEEEMNQPCYDKIRFLHEFGILDFLHSHHPFNTSINSLAKALSYITGEQQSAIQSAINPIFNSKASDKNNPLNSVKKMENVRNKVGNLGFIKPKTT